MNYGLAGGTYRGFSPQSCSQRTINLFPETISAKGEPVQRRLVHVPGKTLFGTQTGTPGRGSYTQDGRFYVAGGAVLSEVLIDGSVVVLGAIAAGTTPVTFAGNGANGHQVLVISSGVGYIFDTVADTLTIISDPQFPTGVISCGYLDGYFLVITQDRFQISASENGLAWGADVGQRLGAAEHINGAIVDHEVVWLFGETQAEVWYDSGNASFPIEPVPGVFLEYGLEASWALCKVGDSILWFGRDERGARQVFRNQGYNAVPVSHEGISAFLTTLEGGVSDARMFGYQIHGHPFAVLTIPSQDVTLQYDMKEDEWSELAYWNSSDAVYEADRSCCHVYVFDKHLTLDRETGAIWELSMDVFADGAAPKRWLRRGPIVGAENTTVFHHRAELDASMGVGLSSGQGSDPTVMLRYSDDRGQTWGSELTASIGAQGHYANRARWHRLGSSRGRVYELSGTDPVPVVLNELYLTVAEGAH